MVFKAKWLSCTGSPIQFTSKGLFSPLDHTRPQYREGTNGEAARGTMKGGWRWFWISQAEWKIIALSTRMWSVDDIAFSMGCCIIIHTTIVKNRDDYIWDDEAMHWPRKAIMFSWHACLSGHIKTGYWQDGDNAVSEKYCRRLCSPVAHEQCDWLYDEAKVGCDASIEQQGAPAVKLCAFLRVVEVMCKENFRSNK